MAEIRVVHLDDQKRFAEMREFFAEDNSGLRLTRVEVDGPCELRTEHGGMRVFWLYRGRGEVFLPAGYRTQEGDGQRLPDLYQPDSLDRAFRELLGQIEAGRSSIAPAARVPIDAIVARHRGEAFVGDYLGDLWRLDHVPRPWAGDPGVASAIEALFGLYRVNGYSTKRVESFEPVMEGDQLIATDEGGLRVRGRFSCLAMEKVDCPTSHVSAARRLRHLADTAGGCNPDFDPFRRLPLTWFYNYPSETGDGLNWVNSHVVNIPAETSPSHFHPPKGIGPAGGIPQREMYLTLDPAAYRLNTWGRTASLVVFPDLRELRRFERHPLEPGMFVYIPPGTGHRGLDVLVNVLTIPGFKPHNEYYLDRDIHDAASGQSPYNESLLDAKNYERIENLL